MDHQDPHPHGDVSRARVVWMVGGNVRGTLEGWGCYIRPARGGESSVHLRGAYRSRSIGHTIVAPGVDREHLAFAGCTRSYPLRRRHERERNIRRDSEVCCWEKRTKMGTHERRRPVIVSTVHPCCGSSRKRRERRSPTSRQRIWTCLRYRRELSLSDGKEWGGNVHIIDRQIDRSRVAGPCELVFAEGRALCLMVVTLAGVRAARCRQIRRFPVFLSGGAWCRLLGFSSDKTSFSHSLYLRLALASAIHISASFALSLYSAPSHRTSFYFCSRALVSRTLIWCNHSLRIWYYSFTA